MKSKPKETQQKRLIVSADDLAAVHNQLCILHPTGEDIMGVANSIMTLRRLLETSPSCGESQDETATQEEGK